MGLSDEERRRLEKLEQELAATDPDLARKLQSGAARGRATRNSVLSILTVIAGFALVITGIITELTIIGALGFLVMVAGADWFLRSLGR